MTRAATLQMAAMVRVSSCTEGNKIRVEKRSAGARGGTRAGRRDEVGTWKRGSRVRMHADVLVHGRGFSERAARATASASFRAPRRFKGSIRITFSRATPKTVAGTPVGLVSSPRRAPRETAFDASRRSRVGAWARTFGRSNARGEVVGFGAKACGSLDRSKKISRAHADLSSRAHANWSHVLTLAIQQTGTQSTKIFFFRDRLNHTQGGGIDSYDSAKTSSFENSCVKTTAKARGRFFR